jgi:hypothetical protein
LKLKASPDGNGIFIACFSKIPPPPPPVPELPLALETREVTEEPGQERTKKHRKKKVKDVSTTVSLKIKSKTARSLPRLSKSLALSISRLSIPRKSYVDALHPSKSKMLRHDSKFEYRDKGGFTSSEDDEEENVEEGEGGGERRRGRRLKVRKLKSKTGSITDGEEEFGDIDIGVFGVSLRKFYEPKITAIRQMDQKNIKPVIERRWIYPVSLFIFD